MGNSHAAGPQREEDPPTRPQQPQKNKIDPSTSCAADAALGNGESPTAANDEIVTTAAVKVLQTFVRRALSKREAESPPALPPPRLERAMTEELVDAFFSDKANTPVRAGTGREAAAAGTPNAFAAAAGGGGGGVGKDGGDSGATAQVELSSILQAHSDSIKMTSCVGRTRNSSAQQQQQQQQQQHSSFDEDDSSSEHADEAALPNLDSDQQPGLAEAEGTSVHLPPRFTQKRRYLQHLKHLIGPAPVRRTWRDEFPRALAHADWLADVYSVAEGKEIRPDKLNEDCPNPAQRRIWITNINKTVTLNQLWRICKEFGQVEKVDLLCYPRVNHIHEKVNHGKWQPRFMGCGYVLYESKSSVVCALKGLHGRKVRGKGLQARPGDLCTYFRHIDRRGWADHNIGIMSRLHGWDDQTAEMLHLLIVFGSIPIGRAVRERENALSASCHTLSATIAERAKVSREVAPLLYLPYRGRPDMKLPYGLVDVEPEAEYLEVPDVTGSCAVHCSAPRVLFDAPQYLRFDGPLLFNRHTGRWVEVDSDVVCIKSLPTPPGMPYLQTAVPFAGKITQKRYLLPPNTLLTLQKVEGPPFTARFKRWVMLRDTAGGLKLLDRNGGKDGGIYKFFEGRKIGRRGELKFAPTTRNVDVNREWQTLSELRYDPEETFSKQVNRRLLTVTPRYMLPTDLAHESGLLSPGQADVAERAACKFGPSVTELRWANTEEYVKGCENITHNLSHDFATEWTRMLEWEDRDGKVFTCEGCWDYVTGPAQAGELDTAVPRDIANDGKLPQDFLQAANEHLLKRLKLQDQRIKHSQMHQLDKEQKQLQASSSCHSGNRRRGRRQRKQHSAQAQSVSRSEAELATSPSAATSNTATRTHESRLLCLDEVLAVRLYTGPAYHPINRWLREVFSLPTDTERRQAALNKETSFGNTVRLLTSALRKLASVSTKAEASRPVFRGLRGHISGSFWVPDDHGLVCATDQAFGSCSLSKTTPIHFMDGGGQPNVLLELRQSLADSAGLFHCGADVSLVSQYAAEQEVMFPPMTMLRVLPRDGGVPLESSELEKDREHWREHQAMKLHSVNTATSAAASAVRSPVDAVTKTIRAMRKIRSVLDVSEQSTDNGVSYLHVVVVPTFTG